MSIIERAAKLLGSVPRADPGAPATGPRIPSPDLITRAAELAGESHPPAAREPLTETAPVSAPERSLRRAKLHCAVDRNRLRALNLITPDGERTPLAESFRRIKRQILAKAASPREGPAPANLVLVTSAMPGEGKTYCAINLAISMALERDRTVLLVDGDVAKPSVPKALGVHAQAGLVELLLDPGLGWNDVVWQTDLGGLSLLPAGAAYRHATELLSSDTMASLLGEMAKRYSDRVVVFDSPPLLAASEAAALAGHVGQIVVVVEAGKTSEATLKQALGLIDATKVTGLLLNKVESAPLEYGYGYGAYP